MRARYSLIPASFGALLLWLTPGPATAQRTISYDTLSGDTPVALTCGFCAGEKLGVVFRDLPAPARGLDPEEFPLVVDAVQVALASANVTGTTGDYTCNGSVMGGSAPVDIEVWAGTALPSGSIRAMPETGPWPGESTVWASADLPLTMSVADMEGSMRYEVMFNRLLLEDEMSMPVRVPAGNVYLRVVVTLLTGTASSASCDDVMLEPPAAFPVRDNDGRIAPERGFIYASGVGWLWNEEASVNGDWGLRIEVTPEGSGPNDAGMTSRDAGATDAGAGRDAGPVDGAVDGGSGGGGTDDGCGCAAPGSRPAGAAGTIALIALLACAAWRRRRARSAARGQHR